MPFLSNVGGVGTPGRIQLGALQPEYAMLGDKMVWSKPRILTTTFTDSGPYVIPPWATILDIVCIGGGGGGRGGSGGNGSEGGGGYAGVYTGASIGVGALPSVGPGATLTITVGLGGAGGPKETNGKNGGESRIDSASGTLMTGAAGAGRTEYSGATGYTAANFTFLGIAYPGGAGGARSNNGGEPGGGGGGGYGGVFGNGGPGGAGGKGRVYITARNY